MVRLGNDPLLTSDFKSAELFSFGAPGMVSKLMILGFMPPFSLFGCRSLPCRQTVQYKRAISIRTDWA